MKKASKRKRPAPGPVSLEKMSKKEYLRWMEDPENRKAYREEAARAARGDYPDLSPEQRAAARFVLERLEEEEHLRMVNAKIQQVTRLIKEPELDDGIEAYLKRCTGLFDEITDELLEMPEPYRTRMLKWVVPLREYVQAAKAEFDREQREGGAEAESQPV